VRYHVLFEFSNRQKQIVLTIQSVWMLTWQRPYDDVACPYAEVVVDYMEIIDWLMWMNPIVTRGIILTSGLVPCGPVMGCHVAPYYVIGLVV
jgi:hypothetical protein